MVSKPIDAATELGPAMNERPSCKWAKLIRKLRWIGLEDEARRLELAVRTLPAEERGSTD
jgi:hypothetical protein